MGCVIVIHYLLLRCTVLENCRSQITVLGLAETKTLRCSHVQVQNSLSLHSYYGWQKLRDATEDEDRIIGMNYL